MNSNIDEHRCILTIDLEDWYHGKYPGFDYRKHNFTVHRVVEPTLLLLDIIEKCGGKATFFALGEIARQYKELIRDIAERGHEIASHGYEHVLAWELGREKWRDDLLRSKEVLENILGREVIGYRAPNFSLDPKRTPWAFEILEKEGFLYDSSIFPAKMYYGGCPKCNRFVHKIGNLWEFPVSALNIWGIRLIFSGGFYMRVLPINFLRKAMKTYWKINSIPVAYLHPKDMDLSNPRLPIDIFSNIIHKIGTSGFSKKAAKIIQFCSYISIKESLNHVWK